MDKVNPETANACWKNLWSEAINDFKGFPGIDEEINTIIQTARDVGGEGFVHMIDEEVEEHIEEHQKVLTHEELEDLVKSSSEECEEIEIESAM
jgi:restriction endonuclease Mrr